MRIIRVYSDSSVYVKYFKDERGSENVKRIIQIARKNKLLKIFMSLWTINETVTAIDKYQKNIVSREVRDKIIATILDTSVKYLQTYPNIVFVPVTSSIVKDSISLIHSFHISADDALHVQTAIKQRCKYFILSDGQLKRQAANNIQGMTITDITNLNDTERFFNDVRKYESFTIEKWKSKSLKGEVCAVFSCSIVPTYECPKCHIHYCHEHVENHKHVLSNEEIESWNRETENLR
jgi:predicted nucleic acid-binding protein